MFRTPWIFCSSVLDVSGAVLGQTLTRIWSSLLRTPGGGWRTSSGAPGCGGHLCGWAQVPDCDSGLAPVAPPLSKHRQRHRKRRFHRVVVLGQGRRLRMAPLVENHFQLVRCPIDPRVCLAQKQRHIQQHSTAELWTLSICITVSHVMG